MTTDKYIYLLLRLALHNREVDLLYSLQIDWTTVNWQHLYDTAKAQGVVAIVFDGVKRVMEQRGDNLLGMPRSLKMRWLSVVDSVEKKSATYHKALEFIASACQKQGLSVMVFKGLSLSRLYPEPLHRECGDIDLYAFDGRRKELDRLIVDLGGELKHDSVKHSELELRSVMIENHNYFVHRYFSDQAVKMNTALTEYACSTEPFAPNKPLYFPNSEFDRLFVLYHAANHFKFEGISLRHIIDWCFVVQRAGYDVAALNEYGLQEFSAVLCRIGRECLGFDLPDDICRCDDETYSRVLNDVVGSDVGKSGEKVAFFTLLCRKTKRFFSRHWAYRLVNDSFFGGVVNSVTAHVVEPLAIFRGSK